MPKALLLSIWRMHCNAISRNVHHGHSSSCLETNWRATGLGRYPLLKLFNESARM